MNLELTGKAAIVTGSSRGIGRAVALELAREGADVALAGRDEARLEAAAAEIAKTTGRRAIWAACDTRDSKAVEALVARTVEAFGRVDILVNNAAVSGGLVNRLADATEEKLAEDLDTKVMGYFRCIKAVEPHMRRQRYGRIINIGGLSGRPSTNLSGLRNVAVEHLTKTLAFQLGASGITVNLIHPGATRTERDAPGVERGADRNAIGRMLEPRETGHLICFLSSPKAAAVTGTIMDCAGGYVYPIFPQPK